MYPLKVTEPAGTGGTTTTEELLSHAAYNVGMILSEMGLGNVHGELANPSPSTFAYYVRTFAEGCIETGYVPWEKEPEEDEETELYLAYKAMVDDSLDELLRTIIIMKEWADEAGIDLMGTLPYKVAVWRMVYGFLFAYIMDELDDEAVEKLLEGMKEEMMEYLEEKGDDAAEYAAQLLEYGLFDYSVSSLVKAASKLAVEELEGEPYVVGIGVPDVDDTIREIVVNRVKSESTIEERVASIVKKV